MKNKNVGYLIVGIAIIIGFIVLLFNLGMKDIVAQSCSHGSACSMYGTITIQTWISVAITGLLLIIGLFFVFSKEETRVITKTKRVPVKEKKKKIDFSKLNNDEKKIMKSIQDADGSIFQSELVEKTGFAKTKVTRILDKLEGRQLVERKRRGMGNVVILK